MKNTRDPGEKENQEGAGEQSAEGTTSKPAEGEGTQGANEGGETNGETEK